MKRTLQELYKDNPVMLAKIDRYFSRIMCYSNSKIRLLQRDIEALKRDFESSMGIN